MSELIRLFFATDTFILRVSINLCLYEDIVPVPFFAVGNHAFKIGPIVVGAGHGAVDISIENEDLVLFCIFFADMDLPFDGLLGLVFGRIAGVNDGCFQMCNSPFVISFSVIRFCKRARIFRQKSCLSLFCKAERVGLPMQRISPGLLVLFL